MFRNASCERQGREGKVIGGGADGEGIPKEKSDAKSRVVESLKGGLRMPSLEPSSRLRKAVLASHEEEGIA